MRPPGSLRVVSALGLLLAASASGCLDATTTERLPIILVEETLSVAGEGEAFGDFGPACNDVSWDGGAGDVTIRRFGEDDFPDLIVLRDFRDIWDRPLNLTMRSEGGWDRGFVDADTDVFLKSPLVGAPAIAFLRIENGSQVWVDAVENGRIEQSHQLVAGAPFHYEVSYRVTTRTYDTTLGGERDSTWNVTHAITFQHVGERDVHFTRDRFTTCR